jgi:hypothetical protein
VLTGACSGNCLFGRHHDDLASIVGLCRKCSRVFAFPDR